SKSGSIFRKVVDGNETSTAPIPSTLLYICEGVTLKYLVASRKSSTLSKSNGYLLTSGLFSVLIVLWKEPNITALEAVLSRNPTITNWSFWYGSTTPDDTWVSSLKCALGTTIRTPRLPSFSSEDV